MTSIKRTPLPSLTPSALATPGTRPGPGVAQSKAVGGVLDDSERPKNLGADGTPRGAKCTDTVLDGFSPSEVLGGDPKDDGDDFEYCMPVKSIAVDKSEPKGVRIFTDPPYERLARVLQEDAQEPADLKKAAWAHLKP